MKLTHTGPDEVPCRAGGGPSSWYYDRGPMFIPVTARPYFARTLAFFGNETPSFQAANPELLTL